MKVNPTRKQAEHLGDAVLHIAARDLTFSLFKNKQKYYFHWIQKIVSNENFSSFYPTKRTKRKRLLRAKQFEIDIGKLYFNNGVEFALKVAKHRIKQTLQWANLMEHYNSLSENDKEQLKTTA